MNKLIYEINYSLFKYILQLITFQNNVILYESIINLFLINLLLINLEMKIRIIILITKLESDTLVTRALK